MKRFSRSVKTLINAAVITGLMCGLTGCTNDFDNQGNESVTVTQKKVEEETSAVSETLSQEEEEYAPEYEITGWAMKDLVTDMEVEGDTFSLPCTVSDIGKEYSVDTLSYQENNQTTGGILYKNDTAVGFVYFNGNVKEDILNADIKFFFMSGGYEFELPQFNVMGITNESTREDVVNILGEPNMHPDASDRLFAYGFNKNEYIMINFSEEDPDKIWLFFIIYNVEE